MAHAKHHPKTPHVIGPYSTMFLGSPAFRYLRDFIAASRQYHVPLAALLGIAYHESGFFSNTPPGTSVMGGISGPGAGTGVAGAHDQIFYAARTLRGYIKQNSAWNWTTALNYYNTGNTGSGYGADAMRIGNSFHFSGIQVSRKRGHHKSGGVSLPIEYWHVQTPWGTWDVPIGIDTTGAQKATGTVNPLDPFKPFANIGQFFMDPAKYITGSFGKWWGGQKGSTLVKWVIGIVAIAILFGATKSLAGGGPKITFVAPSNTTPNSPKVPNVATT